MEKRQISSFNELRHGDKIISPVDCEVTELYIDPDGEKYLTSTRCLFPCYQFNAEDFYVYDGEKKVGEVDREYFRE